MNILFTWELGANFGHLARQLPIAHLLRQRGHELHFAVRDTGIAAKLLGPHGYRFLQAPLVLSKPRLRMPPANYSEILLAEGFHDAAALSGRVQAWRNLFEIIQPDSILIDHAPSALLAARIAGLPRVMFGNGFEIPPTQTPYPNFRAWEGVADSRLIKSERLALTNINSVCGAQLHAVHEIFAGAAPALITLPELDHYGAREADYLGPIHAQLGGAKIDWPKGAGKRILAYLRPDVPGFNAIIKILKERADSCILIVPNAPQAWVTQTAGERLTIFTTPIPIEPLLKQCDLGISYGGSGTLSQFALAGVPQFILPKNIEQYLGGMRVQELGAGLVVGQERDPLTLARLLEQALVDPALAQAACNFKIRHANITVEQVIDRVARMLEQQQPGAVLVRETESPPGTTRTSRVVH